MDELNLFVFFDPMGQEIPVHQYHNLCQHFFLVLSQARSLHIRYMKMSIHMHSSIYSHNIQDTHLLFQKLRWITLQMCQSHIILQYLSRPRSLLLQFRRQQSVVECVPCLVDMRIHIVIIIFFQLSNPQIWIENRITKHRQKTSKICKKKYFNIFNNSYVQYSTQYLPRDYP